MRKNSIKKLLTRLVCAALIASLLVCSSYAAQPVEVDGESLAYDMRPVVFVTGFGATSLAMVKDDGSTEVVFPPTGDALKSAFSGKIGSLIAAVFNIIVFNNFDKLADTLGPIVESIAEPISLNADGTSKYNLVPVVSGAENTSLKAFKESGNLSFVPYTGSEFLDMQSVGDIVGEDKVFNFMYDWRLSHAENAVLFRQYLKDVISLTGADKVNVYSISQGSLIVGSYLYSHPDDGYINNLFFDTPALSGTDLVTDVFTTDSIELNYPVIGDLLAEILHTEFDIGSLLGKLPADALNFAVEYGRTELVLPYVITGVAFWDMVPCSELERLESYWLDPDENAAVIEKTALMHNGFMSHVGETLRAAEQNGINISIKTCYGNSMATGTCDNSDGIVNVKYSCGGTTARWGESFADGYVQQRAGNYAVSPDRTLDLSGGCLPEKTWVINKLYHGQAEWDSRSLKLITVQLMTKGVEDAYSSYEFPQFMESQAPNDVLGFCFTCTNSGFMPFTKAGFAGKTVTLTNLSLEKRLVIKSVESVKGSLNFSGRLPLVLKPGESVELNVSGGVPSANVYDTVTVRWSALGNLFKTQTSSFGATLTDSYAGVVVSE